MNAINKNEVSMFKVGDKIIFAAMGNSVMEYQQCLEMFISQGLIRHATPEEIALGHRIESRNSQAIIDCSLSNLCQNDTQNSLSIKQENQNEVIETQSEKLLGLRDEKAELQKRVDAAFRVLSQLNALDDEAHKRWKREACMFSQGESNAYEHAVRLLEQALKGGGDE